MYEQQVIRLELALQVEKDAHARTARHLRSQHAKDLDHWADECDKLKVEIRLLRDQRTRRTDAHDKDGRTIRRMFAERGELMVWLARFDVEWNAGQMRYWWQGRPESYHG